MGCLSTTEAGMYLENEITMHINKDEQAQMYEAKLQACRLSYSLIKSTGKQPTDVPVMSANFLSNAVVTDDWADYQSGAKTSGDWLSDITCECCDFGDFHPICAICPS